VDSQRSTTGLHSVAPFFSSGGAGSMPVALGLPAVDHGGAVEP